MSKSKQKAVVLATMESIDILTIMNHERLFQIWGIAYYQQDDRRFPWTSPEL
jgi:hypothetical protein